MICMILETNGEGCEKKSLERTSSKNHMCSFFYTIFILFFQGSTMGDVGVAVCCGACGLCQTAVEVQERGDHQ